MAERNKPVQKADVNAGNVTAAPSVCKQAYLFAQQFNCASQYLEQKGGVEQLTVYPKNERAEKITFSSSQTPQGNSLSLLLYRGGDVHPVLNIITDSDQVKAAALVIVKAGLQKNC